MQKSCSCTFFQVNVNILNVDNVFYFVPVYKCCKYPKHVNLNPIFNTQE